MRLLLLVAGVFVIGGCPNSEEQGNLLDPAVLDSLGIDVSAQPTASDVPTSATADPTTETVESTPRDPNNAPITPPGEDTSDPNDVVQIPSDPLMVVTRKGQPVTITLTATPRSADPLRFETENTPVGGSLGPIVNRSAGSADIVYTPSATFTGRATFQYRAFDGPIASAARTVIIIVHPEVRFVVAPTNGRRPLQVTATASTTGGEPFPDALFHWTFQDAGDTEFWTATPMQQYTFQTGGRHTVRLTLLIAGFSTPIVCMAGSTGTSETAVVTVDPVVSGRVTDASGAGLTAVRIDALGTSSTTNTDATGQWSLTLPYGWSGAVTATRSGYSFTPPSWTLNNLTRDQLGVDFRATATPPSNTKPTANDADASSPEDVSSTVALSAIDAEGDPLTYTVVSLPTNGTLRDPSDNRLIGSADLPYTLRSGGNSVKYLANANYNGNDLFQFRAADLTLTSANASVRVTVQPINDAPVAIPQTLAVVGTPTPVQLTALDVEGSPLSFVVTSNPTHGTLSGVAPNLTYTPAAGYSGTDTLSFRASDGQLTSATVAVTLAVTSSGGGGAWQAPIGVPEPPFGVREEVPDSPSPWTGTVAGFYYVDNTVAASTDTSNTNGYPSRPRRTIPSNLPAGAVVKVRGGPYTYTTGGVIPMGGSGTQSQPIFIHGDGPTRPKFQKPIDVRGSYVIIDNIDLDAWSTGNDTGVSFGNNVHHAALRNSEVRNGPEATTSAVSVGGSSGAPARYIVVLNTSIHDNGDWTATYDQDHHGVGVGEYSEHVWILDSQMYHNSGDGIQINAGNFSNMGTLHHVYVGGCEAWENKQTGMWSKFASDIVFSQNTVHGHRPSDSSGGAGMGWQYGPERVWLLYNEIYNCEYGISCATISGPGGDGSGQNQYIIGNVIHDIRQTTSTTTGSWRAGAAITLRQEAGMVHVVNNTIYNCDSGVTNPRPNRCRIVNNIFANITLDHVWVENNNAANGSTLIYSLFDSPGRIRWNGSTQRSLTQFRAAFPAQGAGCLVGNPLFVNAAAGDYHLQSGSPAANAGTPDTVYSTYLTQYSQNIARAFDGAARPIGNWDMGAFER